MSVAFYWILYSILGPVLRSLFRPWVRGGEYVPATGGAILASNHLSFSDSIFLPLMLRRRLTFLAKAEYFTGTGVKGRAKAMFFKGVGQLPVDRSGGKASEAALRSGLRVLRRGQLLGIYPEGTRSHDGRLYRGKTGVAKMALESRVPVIPVAMIGTDKVQPIGRKIPKIHRVGIIIGRPLDFSRYDGLADDRHVLRSVTDEIMYELMRLSGQEYVDEYANVVKERAAAEKRAKVVGEVLGRVERITGRDTSQLSAQLSGLSERWFGDDLSPGDYTSRRPDGTDALDEADARAVLPHDDADDEADDAADDGHDDQPDASPDAERDDRPDAGRDAERDQRADRA
ncbi:lysophospholipid acyltransferase family protein [Aquipuribacter nitratireducens]|uniref:lysophospholipid acyltransferase family protein n=1 Tax=Aquipuribacter nitratireducens TaxID=650104 RepID=UPI003A93A325